MARPKQVPVQDPAAQSPTQEQVAALAGAVEQLTQQVQILTETLDQVREELQWAINNRGEFRCEKPYVMHITSMAKDPLAEDFGERLNRYSAKDLPQVAPRSPSADDESAPPVSCPEEQPELW